jgi:hypothetical protein
MRCGIVAELINDSGLVRMLRRPQYGQRGEPRPQFKEFQSEIFIGRYDEGSQEAAPKAMARGGLHRSQSIGLNPHNKYRGNAPKFTLPQCRFYGIFP